MVFDLTELANVIAERDGITLNEAANAIENCGREIQDILEHATHGENTYDLTAQVLNDWLGLEPDYLMLFL